MDSAALSPSINPDEAAFFGALAQDWWNPKGSSAMLHRITPVRSAFIRDQAASHFARSVRSRTPLAGLTALDIGCGAGLMAEPLARMGAAVTAIDAAAQNIAVAQDHASAGGLAIDYRHTSAEELAATGARFDLVTCLEVVEHVAGRDSFFAALAELLVPGGMAVLSTPNRTAASWGVVIAGAEYITRTIPRGAHDWSRFFQPAELAEALTNVGLHVARQKGLGWSPVRGFVMGDDLSVNYFMVAVNS
ncbi:bifunctional 2-polyprenyl-6-hydroxyphenol methylase/3-demethylubiquinol 3-O-methyltransferase UbiG [Sandarakinorhabdus sp.]|uniref:bifunctional 2-polyprenyl-6-hydroxyphenol methylase/3-demethylubiquinol 3-O-methyltransferase UbiG n=1 Tax=Sandarakinorhabdus sp. TaxID=1916663 RepID=UPI00286DA320|nr:bifunctional 2-polyprenyl-6-hydroxyphenol methylase/3-demethylubiquinol 3-O-methyltransferase UbiG [Sandarakinorhabdus sp.]